MAIFKTLRTHLNNYQKARQLSAKISKQITRGSGKGLDAARVFLTARVKETLSVSAPRTAIRGQPVPGKKRGPIVGYRATTPASPGAPPRKLTGRYRSSVTSMMLNELTAIIGANARSVPSQKYPGGFNYPKYHEMRQPEFARSGEHPAFAPTARKWRSALAVIIGNDAKAYIMTSVRRAT